MNINISKRNLLFICAAVMFSALAYAVVFSLVIRSEINGFVSRLGGLVEATRDNLPSSTEITDPKPEISDGYTLLEYEKKIGVFGTEQRELLGVFDVYAATLPHADRDMLKEGIHVSTKEELVSLYEDYTS